MGLLTNSQRGVWTLTEAGSALLHNASYDDQGREQAVQELRATYVERLRVARKGRQAQGTRTSSVDAVPESKSWKELLLDLLMEMKPDAFERLAKRLLREADFDSVNVTGGVAMVASMG